MSERIKEIRRSIKKPLAMAAAAIALAALAGESKAASDSHPTRLTDYPTENIDMIEAGMNDRGATRWLSMEEVTRQANEGLKREGVAGFNYAGWIKIVGPDGKVKGTILNPILVFRGGTKNEKEWRFAFNGPHLRSKHWAIGYLYPGVGDSHPGWNEARARGEPQRVVMLPINNNGNNMVFYGRWDERNNTRARPIQTFGFPKDKSGQPDVAHPTDGFGKPRLQSDLLPGMPPIPETIGLFVNT